ncbi:MAG: NSS family neurotransmitter:Na+ symporter [Bradymonadia bacterium]|jgi:NSS family neurotransmitter:Na+ symporter
MSERGQWGSRMGFILAAAGSAVGLGNIWKFPYITGENGGGWFVLIYLFCILAVGLPIMISEIMLGRMTQKSPVGAFKALSPKPAWQGVGWMGVAAGFIILSFYSVVAGWALHYVYLSATGTFAEMVPAQIPKVFGEVYADTTLNLTWHVVFMVLTIGIVVGGVKKGVERAARILMPVLGLMMLGLLIKAFTMDGFGQAADFVFGLHADKLKPAGVLEALGHSFFTLSLGMGAMLTYGSYLSKKEDLVGAAIAITVLDTVIALMACLILFPITFTFGMGASAGPGLVFANIPVALSQMPGGTILCVVFFALLVFAALTSAISLLEVVASYFIDEKGWSRPMAVVVTGGTILIFGIPSALSGGTELFGSGFAEMTQALGFEKGKNWFDFFDYLASNWLLPLGGMGIALFTAWGLKDKLRRVEFGEHGPWARFYGLWLNTLRYFVPIAVLAVFGHMIGLW